MKKHAFSWKNFSINIFIVTITILISTFAMIGVAAAVTDVMIDGNLGVGTTNPSARLGAVQDTPEVAKFIVASSTTLTTPNLYVSNKGNVGVGTINPRQTLEVNGNIRLPLTTATKGIIYVDNSLFIHNYGDPTSDAHNTFVGVGAGNLTMGPAGGDSALGSYNVAVGTQSLLNNTTGYRNTAVGHLTLAANTAGGGNVAVGTGAMQDNTTGNVNTALGYGALANNTTAWYNTALGVSALITNTTGDSNTAVGTDAMFLNTTGSANDALGRAALYSNTTGTGNLALGYYSMKENTTGVDNVAVGRHSLFSNTAGNYNTAIGIRALNFNTGSSNVALGYMAGFYETGSNKLFIDNTSRASEADGRSKALIYGVFAAAVANQRLTINGQVQINGTATATSDFVVGTEMATATSTLKIKADKTGANGGSCLEMNDVDGTTYALYVNNGELQLTAGTCK